ncbi:hypothetical protein K456DRAFT_1659505 [Colletotrichum gloeosporioides 23]|nr:hypothetical protein K456DRAFT_1659505 [Colletotrichum gloeosporioides 23]
MSTSAGSNNSAQRHSSIQTSPSDKTPACNIAVAVATIASDPSMNPNKTTSLRRLRHLRRCRQLQPSSPSWQTRQDRYRECSPKPSPTEHPSQPSKTPVHRQADRRLSRRRNSKHTPPKRKTLVFPTLERALRRAAKQRPRKKNG